MFGYGQVVTSTCGLGSFTFGRFSPLPSKAKRPQLSQFIAASYVWFAAQKAIAVFSPSSAGQLYLDNGHESD